jgi:hypothetical protein
MSGELGCIDVPSLKWEQPKWTQRLHRLVCGETVYATMEWPQAFRSTAVSNSREGRYTFKRGGFLHPFITVRRQEFEMDHAKLSLDWKGNGELVFTNAQRFTFTRDGLARFDYQVTDHRGDRLFSLKKEMSAIKHSGEVHITPAGMNNREIALLVTLAWYLAVMVTEDAATASSAAVASGCTSGS